MHDENKLTLHRYAESNEIPAEYVDAGLQYRMFTVNEVFDVVYVLNLKRREDRWTTVDRRLKECHVYATRSEAVDGRTNVDVQIQWSERLSEGQRQRLQSVAAYVRFPWKRRAVWGMKLTFFAGTLFSVENKRRN